MLKQLSSSENLVASTPLKEKASFLLRHLYSGASGFCYGNSDCDPVRKLELDLYQVALASAL